MIWSPEDAVLEPPESGKFSFYNENYNQLNIEKINDLCILYKN
jgi:hypothetical protein